jgi:hypothetical protein
VAQDIGRAHFAGVAISVLVSIAATGLLTAVAIILAADLNGPVRAVLTAAGSVGGHGRGLADDTPQVGVVARQ